MSRSGWLAIGAVVAALGGGAIGAPAGGAAFLVAIIAVGAAALARRLDPSEPASRRARVVLAFVVGGGAVLIRLSVAPSGPPSTNALPDGRGPWRATVETRSPDRDGQQVATLRIDLPSPTGSTATLLVAATLPRYPTIAPSQIVSVGGPLQPIPAGPYGDYLRRIGVEGTLRASSMAVTAALDGPGPALERLRQAAGDALAAAIPEPEAGLAAGIMIGLRDRVDRDLAADFTTAGASHVVAISGWNIAIVAATVAALAGRFGRRRRSIVLLVAIVAYVLFAGSSASVVRAAAMAGVVLLARETGRAGRATAALGWAVAILLVVEPALVGDAGFQLSTLATAGILAWTTGLDRRLRQLGGGRIPGWLAESLSVSLAAQAATLPVVLATFGRLSIVAPLVNLAIVPLVAPAMAAALLALAGGAIALLGGPPGIGTVAGLPAWGLLTALSTIVRIGAGVPFASLTLAPPIATAAAIAITVVPAAVVFGWRWRRRGPAPARQAVARSARVAAAPAAGRPTATAGAGGYRIAVASLALAVVALALVAAHRTDGTTRITVLDVGQGDSILVEGGGGGRMLIDGGPDPDRLLVELDRRLPPWDRRIDILIRTHPHEDHVAGLPILLGRYQVGRIYETGMRGPGPGYGAFAKALGGAGGPPHATLSTGARISLDDIRFRVLWPDPGRVPREPPDAGRGINDVSIVLLGEVAGRRFLLTGDVEDDVDPLLAQRGLPPIDVLKVAHHGSATASTPAFLDAVRPRVAIVSAGAGNPYGHPARSTIQRLAATGARVLRTDTEGSVAVAIAPDGTIEVDSSGARKVALEGTVRAWTPPADSLARPAALDRAVDPAAGRPPGPITVATARLPGSGPGVRFSCGIPSSG